MHSKNENKQQQKHKTKQNQKPKKHTMKIFTAQYPEILTYPFVCCLRDLYSYQHERIVRLKSQLFKMGGVRESRFTVMK